MTKSARTFLFAHLRTASGGWQALHDHLSPVLAGWQDTAVLGSFTGLFGISNQELFVLLSRPVSERVTDRVAGQVTDQMTEPLRTLLPAGVEMVDSLWLDATVRPTHDAPLTRAGVYVFRFFQVNACDCDEVVSLSSQAWQTFENSDSYTSEPMGLFRFADTSAIRGRMLLLTWYDNMTSWERSRTPHPDATANFRRRASLSRSIVAYATRLADTVPR